MNLPGDEDHKVVYDGQPHEATIELVSDGLNYLLDKYETVQTEDGGRALKVYYRELATGELKEEAPTEIGTYQILYKEGTLYFSTNWVFKITENIHRVTVTDGFIVKVEHPGAVGTDDTTGDDTTEDPISTATVQYGDKVTVTYLRKKAKKTATLTLKNEQGNTNIVKDADLDVLGGTFRPVTEQEKKDMNISYGLAVTKVANGALKDAAVYKGFIILQANDAPMKTLNDLQKAVKSASTSKDPVLYIQGMWPTGKKAYFAVPLQKD